MRYVNVFKCWPFPADDLTREEITSQLPPMEVPKMSSDHDREDQTKKQPKVEDVSPSEDNLQPPPPPPLLPVKRELPPTDDGDGENSGMASSYQLFKERLHAPRSNIELPKFENVNLNTAKQEEKFDMVCSICRVFKTITVTLMDKHMSDCLEKRRREEERLRRPSSDHNPKRRRGRTLTEIFNLPSQIEAADDKNVLIEKITTLPKNEF